MALSAKDRDLLKRLLHREPGSWNEFVERYLGLALHVVQQTAHFRSVGLNAQETEDAASQVMLSFADDDFAVLRDFRGDASLTSYLIVQARRACVQGLARRQATAPAKFNGSASREEADDLQRVLGKLPKGDAEVARLFYREGRSYEEIGTELKIPVHSIGAILARVKARLDEEE